MNIQTDGQLNKHIDRQTDKHIDRLRDRHTEISKQTERYRETDNIKSLLQIL